MAEDEEEALTSFEPSAFRSPISSSLAVAETRLRAYVLTSLSTRLRAYDVFTSLRRVYEPTATYAMAMHTIITRFERNEWTRAARVRRRDGGCVLDALHA